MQRLVLLLLVSVATSLAFDCWEGADASYLQVKVGYTTVKNSDMYHFQGCKYCFEFGNRVGCGKDNKKVKDQEHKDGHTYCTSNLCNETWLLYDISAVNKLLSGTTSDFLHGSRSLTDKRFTQTVCIMKLNIRCTQRVDQQINS